MPEEHRTPASPCPWCGYLLDTATNVIGGGGPRAGDVSLCLKCAMPLQFDAELKNVKIGDAELREGLDARSYARFMEARRTLLTMDRSKMDEPPNV